MEKRLTAILLFAGMLAFTACGVGGLTTTTAGLGDTSTTGAGPTSSSAADMSGAIEEIQTEITELQTQIQNSAAAQDLQNAWTTLTAELTAALSSMSQGGVIDSTQVQDALDEFQSDLEALGDQVEPELIEAWNALREKIESLIS